MFTRKTSTTLKNFKNKLTIKASSLEAYASSDNIWLNSKYIKTKCKRKLKVKFFRPFQVSHLVGKQAYKFELFKRWKMHNIFYMSLLEQDITKKEQIDKRVTELELKAGNNKEYKVEAIWNNTVYTSKLESGHLPGLYYLVAWKGYPKEKNT